MPQGPHWLKLISNIQLRASLPAAELAWLQKKSKRRILSRGELFCVIGQNRHEFAYLAEGVMQVYGISPDGEHIVLDFQFPGSFALALESAMQGQPSRVCIEAVTPCVLLVWPYELRREATARHPGWLRFEARLTEEAFLRKQQRYLSLRTKTAQQRYVNLDSELPAAWHDIPQHLIASYLDVTPQYLSTLKRTAPGQSTKAGGR